MPQEREMIMVRNRRKKQTCKKPKPLVDRDIVDRDIIELDAEDLNQLTALALDLCFRTAKAEVCEAFVYCLQGLVWWPPEQTRLVFRDADKQVVVMLCEGIPETVTVSVRWSALTAFKTLLGR